MINAGMNFSELPKMNDRWTIELLNSISDVAFINAILGERRANLKRYAPLERKLKTIQDKLVMGATFDQNGNLKKGQ